MNIIDAIHRKDLFKPCFKQGLDSWSGWLTLLRALFGLTLDEADLDLFRRCTGRETAPQGPFRECFSIIGRRGGKSFISSIISVYLALFNDYSKYLGPGERGVIQIVAADRGQAQVILNYIKGILHSNPVFEQYVDTELKETVDLTNGITIEVMSCSFRSIRGRTVVCAIFDEMAYWRIEGAAPDKEILSAIRPAMATIPTSMLICISSPYARSGSIYETHRDYLGQDDPDVLVWQSPTRVRNPTLSQDLIARETLKDPSAAAAEWQAEFRDDIETFLAPDQVEACATLPGELGHEPDRVYQAFVDPSGGRADAFTLAIGFHARYSSKLRAAVIKAWDPPFNPEVVVYELTEILKRYRIRTVTGDRYAGSWVTSSFEKFGIEYQTCDKPKSDLYLMLEGLINTGRVEFAKDERLKTELINLERRRGRQGKDQVDHPPRGSDDLANALAGLTHLLVKNEHSFFAEVL
jgi:hypothetical protein